jgi:glycosyltransferase involved in cell wall biosynthesis
MKPLVSILMPVYNAAPFLRQAVDGILDQTFRDFELILVNDGSTDDSEKIIRSYSDSRIRLHNQPNAGVARALNKALELAEGQYIARHDADDFSPPDKLEKQVRFLETHPDFVLCSTQTAFMTERGKIAWDYRQPHNDYFGTEAAITVKREHFNPYSPITHGCVLVRADIMRSFNGYRTEFKTAEDVDLWLRILQKHKMAVLKGCSYFLRLNKNSATRRHGSKNKLFRDVAFQYYDQRAQGSPDELQAGRPLVLPAEPPAEETSVGKGRLYRGDLLPYLLPLHLNAKDWKGAAEIIRYSIRDGWKLKRTWRDILFPVMGKRLVATGVKIKRGFK